MVSGCAKAISPEGITNWQVRRKQPSNTANPLAPPPARCIPLSRSLPSSLSLSRTGWAANKKWEKARAEAVSVAANGSPLLVRPQRMSTGQVRRVQRKGGSRTTARSSTGRCPALDLVHEAVLVCGTVGGCGEGPGLAVLQGRRAVPGAHKGRMEGLRRHADGRFARCPMHAGRRRDRDGRRRDAK